MSGPSDLLGQDAWGKLTLWHLYKCLNKTQVTPKVLEQDAKGKLTLKGIFGFSLSVKSNLGLYPAPRMAGFEQIKALKLFKCWVE